MQIFYFYYYVLYFKCIVINIFVDKNKIKKITAVFLVAIFLITAIFIFFIFHFETLTPPVHISAEPLSYSEILVSWEEDGESKHYNIYRSTDQDSYYLKIGSTEKGEYIDKDLSPSTAYYYKVTKIIEYEESDFSSRATAFTKPMMPTGLEATSEDFQETMRLQVNLSWNYSFVADKYNIYRSLQKEGPYEKIGETGIESYSDNNVDSETIYYYTITQVANNTESVYSDVVEVLTSEEWLCGDVISYGGKDYETVIIGSRCWFKENLNIDEEDIEYNCAVEKKCYREVEENCDIYGGLYDFSSASCNEKKEGTRGICPTGWRIPTDDDWSDLEVAVGMSEEETKNYGYRGSSEASKISGGYELWAPGELREDKDFSSLSFNIFPGGYMTWRADGVGETVFLWSSTSSNEDRECQVRGDGYKVRVIDYNNKKIKLSCFAENNRAYVRCARPL